jgi:hypothetical protein
VTASDSAASAAEPDRGWDRDEAAARIPRHELYEAQARREWVRDGVVDPDGTGCAEYECRYFDSADAAEAWLLWKLAQWPKDARSDGTTLEAQGFVMSVRFQQPTPRDAASTHDYTGTVDRAY